MCGKTFGHSGGLKTHINNVHEGIRSHKCKICGKLYSGLSMLKLHIKNNHNKNRKFECFVVLRKLPIENIILYS